MVNFTQYKLCLCKPDQKMEYIFGLLDDLLNDDKKHG